MMVRLLLLFSFLVFPLPLFAQDAEAPASNVRVESEETRQVREVAKELRCAVCQNESVADSNSQLARDMRDLILDQVRQGKTHDEIKAFFVSRYGDYILMEPRTEGFNLILWIAPFAALLAGILLLSNRARRARNPYIEPGRPEETAHHAADGADELIATLRRSAGEEGNQK